MRAQTRGVLTTGASFGVGRLGLDEVYNVLSGPPVRDRIVMASATEESTRTAERAQASGLYTERSDALPPGRRRGRPRKQTALSGYPAHP